MNSAPIALFVYNRLQHLQRTIEALLQNAEAAQSELFIFSDAAKTDAGAATVSRVREYIHRISGFSAVHIIEREFNFGLARSVIDGVSQICREHGRVIVLEDDMVTSPYFLKYMNAGLAIYYDDERVASIHGYLPPISASPPDSFFLRGADCWGWATWHNRWTGFDQDGTNLLNALEAANICYEFDLDDSYPYTDMLRDQVIGINDSWAIRWHASCFLRELFTLHPGISLVQNIGNDGKVSTHAKATDVFDVEISDHPINLDRIPIEENKEVREAFKTYFCTIQTPRLLGIMKLWRYIRRQAHRVQLRFSRASLK